jgi:hypothetical protein
MITTKCKDCYKEHTFENDTVLVICNCGGLVYDKEEVAYLPHKIRHRKASSNELKVKTNDTITSNSLSCLTFAYDKECWKEGEMPEELIK